MANLLRLILKIVLILFTFGVTLGIGMSILIPLVIKGQDLPSFYGLRIIGGIILDAFLIWIILKL